MKNQDWLQRSVWRPASEWAPLGDDVHIWRAALDRGGAEALELERHLSRDERARAARLVFDTDRRRFITTRGILRALLGRYTGRRPEDIHFQYGPQGKPSISGQCNLRFNVSHSAGLALIACAHNREVGIDVERERSDVEFEHIATRFFSLPEQAALKALPVEQRGRAFFTCWARKEAYIKALGGGLSVPLDRFDMTVSAGEPAKLLADRGDPAAAAFWAVYDVCPDDAYVGAAVVAGQGGSLKLWDWPEPVS